MSIPSVNNGMAGSARILLLHVSKNFFNKHSRGIIINFVTFDLVHIWYKLNWSLFSIGSG